MANLQVQADVERLNKNLKKDAVSILKEFTFLKKSMVKIHAISQFS